MRGMKVYFIYRMKNMIEKQNNRTRVITLRLRLEEYARLERNAAGISLSDYVRSCLFGPNASKRKTRGKFPVKDHKELGQILGELGRMKISENLNHLANSVKSGSLIVSPETEKAIADCCLDIKWICYALIKALGLTAKNDHDS